MRFLKLALIFFSLNLIIPSPSYPAPEKVSPMENCEMMLSVPEGSTQTHLTKKECVGVSGNRYRFTLWFTDGTRLDNVTDCKLYPVTKNQRGVAFHCLKQSIYKGRISFPAINLVFDPKGFGEGKDDSDNGIWEGSYLINYIYNRTILRIKGEELDAYLAYGNRELNYLDKNQMNRVERNKYLSKIIESYLNTPGMGINLSWDKLYRGLSGHFGF
jgi:hypothetical protein